MTRIGTAALLLGCGFATAFAQDDLDAAARGRMLFRNYCVGCHGLDATGCGPSARLYRPRPANLTSSTASAEYKASIIRNGGQAMGRSPFMPPWVGELDEAQIHQVIAYLSTLEPKPSPGC